jgi:hypothetical protein
MSDGLGSCSVTIGCAVFKPSWLSARRETVAKTIVGKISQLRSKCPRPRVLKLSSVAVGSRLHSFRFCRIWFNQGVCDDAGYVFGVIEILRQELPCSDLDRPLATAERLLRKSALPSKF